ncbi:MAG: MurR/RpiR family transcriptional regulator [Chloroflexota bacterium]|nr:MurR/RpiR family transcriptional regulator [Chloroflexota bacterium]
MHQAIVVPAQAIPDAPTNGVKLSRKQRAIVAYIEHNPKFVAFATASDLARRVGVNPGTVVRLAQMLGYRGFPEFQEEIRHRYLASLDAVAMMHAHATDLEGDVVLASIGQDIRNLSATRGALDRSTLRQVAQLVLSARSTLMTGAGSYGGVAVIFAHLCRFMGLPVEAETRGGVTLAPRLAAVGEGDVVIGSAAWWVVTETLQALQIARSRGATTVAVVDNRASALARMADHVLICRTESVSFFQSMTGPLAVINALVAEIAILGGELTQRRMAESTEMFERLGVAWTGENTALEQGLNGHEAASLIAAGGRRGERAAARKEGNGLRLEEGA